LSALWGKRNGSRGSALWGKGGRGVAAMLLSLAMLAGPLTPAADAKPRVNARGGETIRAFVTPTLLKAAKANRSRAFRVIVQGRCEQELGRR